MTSRQSVRKSFEQRLEESSKQREKGSEETVGDQISWHEEDGKTISYEEKLNNLV